MMSRSNNAFIVACAVMVAVPARASAQSAPSSDQVEAARAPFREAREWQRLGKPAEALAKMHEAYRIASTPVIGLEVGKLEIEVGRLVEGRDLLSSVVALPVSPRESDAGREARRLAFELAAQLESRIPKIAFTGRREGLDVALDGRALAEETSVPVDPGAHSVVVRSGPRACSTVALMLAEGEVRTLDLADASRGCAPVAREIPSIATPPVPKAREANDGTGWRVAGAVTAGAGLVAVGFGAYLVVGAKSDYDSVSDGCTARGCSPSAYDVRHSAHARANAATVVTAAGVAALAGGAAMWFFLGSKKDNTQVGLGPATAYLKVVFP